MLSEFCISKIVYLSTVLKYTWNSSTLAQTSIFITTLVELQYYLCTTKMHLVQNYLFHPI